MPGDAENEAFRWKNMENRSVGLAMEKSLTAPAGEEGYFISFCFREGSPIEKGVLRMEGRLF